jgi:hypothetical protein
MDGSPQTKKSLALAAATSLVYAGLLWLAFTKTEVPGFNMMSIAFLFAAPLATGALVNFWAPEGERGSFLNLVLLPAVFSVLPLSAAFLFKIEGLICLVMALPAYVIMASLGACAYYLWVRHEAERIRRRGLGLFLLMPMLVAPVEGGFGAYPRHAVTRNEIEIAAPIDTVWKRVIRVQRIGPGEIPWGLSRIMGFPDPVEATLSHEGLGGVRRASFQGNVLFTETIDAWEAGRLLSFTIVPNTAEIPPTTMDEHMIVGGDYFKVLRGTYSLEDLGGGKTLLRLASDHVAITDFNAFAGLWGSIIMGYPGTDPEGDQSALRKGGGSDLRRARAGLGFLDSGR